MSWEGLGIKENKMISFEENIARNSLKQLLKSSVKISDSFILIPSYLSKLLQQHIRGWSSLGLE